MMNLWVFASAAAFGNPANNTYPFTSEYDWFRFYKSDAETMYPVADPKTGLPAGDVDFSRNNSAETTYPNFRCNRRSLHRRRFPDKEAAVVL
jgi:hypothetical protein